MKKKLFGYTQSAMIELGLNLRDLAFIDWFVHWYSSRRMKMINVDDSGYYGWINREYVIEQIPMLGLTHVQSVTKMLCKLVDSGVLERVVVQSNEGRGSNAFYRPSPLVFDLKHDSDDGKPVDNSDQQPEKVAETPRPATQTGCPNTSIRETNTTIRENMSAEALDPAPPAIVSQQPEKNREIAPLKDTTSAMWEAALTAIQPSDTWGDYGKERKHCGYLAKRSRGMLQQSPYESMEELIQAVIEEFRKLKRNAKQSDAYWSNAPYTPSSVMTRWPQIWHGLAKEHERNVRTQRDAEMYSRLPW